MNGSIRDSHNEILVSVGQSFQLGFFTPDSSSDDRRRVRISYYNFKAQVVLNSWNSGDFSGGCELKFQVCTGDDKIDKFLSLKIMKVGGGAKFDVTNEGGCKKKCISNSSCQAYVYSTTGKLNRCWIWLGKLSNVQEYVDEDHEINVRVAPCAICKFILFELFYLHKDVKFIMDLDSSRSPT